MSTLWRLLRTLDAAEFAVVAVLGALLVILGPVVVAPRFVGQGHYVLAGGLTLLWIRTYSSHCTSSTGPGTTRAGEG